MNRANLAAWLGIIVRKPTPAMSIWGARAALPARNTVTHTHRGDIAHLSSRSFSGQSRRLVVRIRLRGFRMVKQNTVKILVHVGKLLREARQNANKSQQQVATETNIKQSRISEIERSFRNITMETISRLAGALGCRAVVDFVPIRKSRRSDTASPSKVYKDRKSKQVIKI
jgi:ribosome-binding protein aMBF1 (putative translation factor)